MYIIKIPQLMLISKSLIEYLKKKKTNKNLFLKELDKAIDFINCIYWAKLN